MLTDKGKSLLLVLWKEKEQEERQRQITMDREALQWAETRINTMQGGKNPWCVTLAEGHSLDLAVRRLRAVLSLLGIPESEARKVWPGLITPKHVEFLRYDFTLSRSDFIALLETSNKA